jgi:hypothetical protein
MGLKQSHMKRRFNCLGWALFVVGSLCVLKTSPSYSGGMHFELTGVAQSVEPA